MDCGTLVPEQKIILEEALQREKQNAAEQKMILEEALQREKQNAAEQMMILEEALQREKQNAAEQKKIIEELRREKQNAVEQKKILEEELKIKKGDLEYLKKYAVDVILDPDTAFPHLILSEDGKQVREEGGRQNLPDTPKRFWATGDVLGKQGFSSGRFYYEVQVSGKHMWELGVVKESVDRTGIIALCPQDGHWTVKLWNGNEYSANADIDVPLTLPRKVEKVGVFVDYEEGLVSFYDVEIRSHIYSYTHQSFNDKIYPFFRPWYNHEGNNSAPLIILPVNR